MAPAVAGFEDVDAAARLGSCHGRRRMGLDGAHEIGHLPREEIAEVTERVLAYRARLLANVAEGPQKLREVQRVAGVMSLDIAGSRQKGPVQAGGRQAR